MFIDEDSLEITVAADQSGYSSLYPRESRAVRCSDFHLSQL